MTDEKVTAAASKLDEASFSEEERERLMRDVRGALALSAALEPELEQMLSSAASPRVIALAMSFMYHSVRLSLEDEFFATRTAAERLALENPEAVRAVIRSLFTDMHELAAHMIETKTDDNREV